MNEWGYCRGIKTSAAWCPMFRKEALIGWERYAAAQKGPAASPATASKKGNMR
jgi:hypothetical protein